MAIDGMDKLAARIASYPSQNVYKPSISNMAAGILASLWRSAGLPAQGAIPTSATTVTSSTTGALPLPTPGSGETLYVAVVECGNTVAGTVLVYDRLSHMGGLSGTVTSPQTVNLDVATASGQGRCHASGRDVEWYLEWYSDTGSTAVTATASYTNDQDVSGRTSQTISLPATRRASMLYQIYPQVGDNYIKSIQSVTLSATTGTAGNFGVTARKRLCSAIVPIVGVNSISNPFDTGLPVIASNSCVELLFFNSTTSTGNVLGSIKIISA